VTFTLLPAVDVADGQAVRLVQGEAGTETGYGAPREAALAWQDGGAEWIHLVDLDAAFGRGSNAELLAGVVGELDVAVELSGAGVAAATSRSRATFGPCSVPSLLTSVTT
jgi:phosphoribosyl isomerase A